jgi:hypothetical protein
MNLGEKAASSRRTPGCLRHNDFQSSEESRSDCLFPGRSPAGCCRTRSRLSENVEYIHLNPVRAGLVERAEDWPWSSLRDYAGSLSGTTGAHPILPIDLLSVNAEGSSTAWSRIGGLESSDMVLPQTDRVSGGHGPLFQDAVAVDKLLRGPKRRLVQFL